MIQLLERVIKHNSSHPSFEKQCSYGRVDSFSARIRRQLAGVVAFGVALTGLLLPGAAAHAVEIPDAITSVTVDQYSYGYYEQVHLDFTWQVPDSAVEGDTFTLTLPPELETLSSLDFPLFVPNTTIKVAQATWQGKTLTVTLNDYVNTHNNVHGDGYITAAWDQSNVEQREQSIRLVFNGKYVIDVEIDDPQGGVRPGSPHWPLWKGGWWSDDRLEGARDSSHNINWWIALPGSRKGFAGPITVTDTVHDNHILECGTVALWSRQKYDYAAPQTPVDPSRYQLDCSTAGFTVVLDRIRRGEFIEIVYDTTITDQTATEFTNSVEFRSPSRQSNSKAKGELKRVDAGGTGHGNKQPTGTNNPPVTPPVTPPVKPPQVKPPVVTPPQTKTPAVTQPAVKQPANQLARTGVETGETITVSMLATAAGFLVAGGMVLLLPAARRSLRTRLTSR